MSLPAGDEYPGLYRVFVHAAQRSLDILEYRAHDDEALDEIELYKDVLSAVAAADGPLTREELDAALGVHPVRGADISAEDMEHSSRADDGELLRVYIRELVPTCAAMSSPVRAKNAARP